MKNAIFPIFSVFIAVFLAACGGTNLDVPTDLPPICREIDFNSQPDMREICGVRNVRTRAYQNIPQQRYLIQPKEASLVKTNGRVELRLPNTLPIELDDALLQTEIKFDQNARMTKIKNRYDYYEFYPAERERLRIFKITLISDFGNEFAYCFRVPEKRGNDRTRSVAMGNRVDLMECFDFNKLVETHRK
ncbi:MAG: hypothetical protein LBR60_02985 [Fibrobacter sp.]|jgi:hypothetical protein|nr:hypothetical protein [Fibrobacter sp.]